VHNAAHLAPVDVKIFGVSVFENQKTITIRVGMDPAGRQVLPVRQCVMIFLEADDAALAAEGPERIGDML